MKEIMLAEITNEDNKKIQLEILSYVAQFCDDHGLRYFLADGTLLGAIRHKGYIPWDDDIDIQMPRPDYNALAELFQNQGHYKLITPSDQMSRFHNIKIYDDRTVKIEQGLTYCNDYLGVDIDVFALDGSPENEEEFLRVKKKIHDYYVSSCWLKAIRYGSLKNRIRVLVYRLQLKGPERMMDQAIKLCESYNYEKSNYIARYGRFGLGYRLPKWNYESYEMREFEGFRFRIPKGYDEILKADYGDYMTLPPIEEQVTHHKNKAYWK